MTRAQNAKARAAKVAEATNKYDAAGNGRRMRAWNPGSAGPNRVISGLQNIRNRASDVARNDWAGSAGLQHWTTNLIGTGIVPRPKRIKAKKKKQFAIDLWDEWCKQADSNGVLNFYALQTLATRSWLERGEVFARMRSRRSDSGMRVPFQVQLVESDCVPLLDSDQWLGMTPRNRIRSGIELTPSDRRVAYWVYRDHPGDGMGTAGADMSKLIRVPVDQMLHIYEPKRPTQLRGVPDFAAVLAHLRGVMDFADTTLERQKLANLFTVFLKKTGTAGVSDTVDPLTGAAIQSIGGQQAIAMQPGAVVELEDGEDVTFANPPEAGTMYHEYMRTSHLGTAAGQNLPYEMLTGDIREVSDRTLRIIINGFRRFAQQRQWQIIIPMLCQPVRDYWTDTAIIAGLVAEADGPDVKLVEWAPQGWEYIHPTQDAEAKATEVREGFRSRSSVIAEKGDDPEAVDDEIQADKKREKEKGLVFGAAAKVAAKPPKPDGDGIAPGEYPRNAAMTLPNGLTLRLDAQKHAAETRLIEAQTAFYEKGGQAPPVTNVSISNPAPVTNVAAPKVEVTNNVEPTPLHVEVAAPTVEVTNNVSPTPLHVEVAAPKVEVTNNVPAAEVTVNLPDRKIVSEIERTDEQITKVTQTETTVVPTTH